MDTVGEEEGWVNGRVGLTYITVMCKIDSSWEAAA